MLALCRREFVLGAAAGLIVPRTARAGPNAGATLQGLASGIDAEVARLAEDPMPALARVQAVLRCSVASGAFDPWLAWRGRENDKLTLLNGGGLGQSWKVQLFRIAADRSHPPHCHENLASCLVLVEGRLRVREYERLREQETRAAAVLRGVTDAELQPGEGMITAEHQRNAHWFGAVGRPALAVNFKAAGHFRRELLRLRHRRYLDASRGGASPFAAPFLSPAEAKARFAGRPL